MSHKLIAILFLLNGLRAQHPGCSTRADDQGFDLVDCSSQHFQKILPTARVHASQFELMPSAISSHVRALNLSNNELVSLNSSSFSSLRHPETLESLDLSNNKLIFIAPAAFKSLTRLKYLNLSGNRLHTLNRSSFLDLNSLEVLNLDANPLSSFPDRTFSPLVHLKEISIHSNQLACDCQLADLLKFINKEKRVSVTSRTVCAFPITLRGEKLATLQAKSMKKACGRGDFEPDVFELKPSSRSLIVYPGDEQEIVCMVSNVGNVSMEWLKNNVPISASPRLRVSHSFSATIRSLTLTFSPVEWEDEGDWICYAEFRDASLRNTIRLMPISVNTERCVQEWKADEKGEIVWPVSKQGTVSAVCPNGPLNALAFRVCKQGKWSEVDSSACAFSSTLTKLLLHALSHMHALNLLDELINNTTPTYQFSSFETRLAGWVIGNASESNANRLLTAIALALGSKHATTELDGAMLRSRLQSVALSDHAVRLKNLAACELMVLSSTFDDVRFEMSPPQRSGFISAYSHGQYSCHRQENVEFLPANGMTSVRIPWQTLDLFPSVTVLNVFWFANTNIFSNSYTLDGRWVALNQVHAVVLKRVSLKRISPADKLGGFISDSSPAIYFTYYLHIPTEQVRLGVWSNKEWRVASADECSQRRVGPRYVLIACTHAFVIAHLGENITFFTAMQNAELIERLTAVRKGIGLPWWMYMSSGFLASSMAFVVLSNVCCMKQVVSCKLLHILINLCSSILFLCVFFTLGVNKVFDEFICRISGALIHFFFLVTFYWLMLSMRTVQKKISKMASTKQQHVVDEESEQCESGKVAAHGPIAGLYFLAYGVPLFAVSFSIAIDAGSYTASPYCCFPPSSLQSKVFQFGLLFPFVISFVLIVLFYAIGRCHFDDLKRSSQSRSLSDIAKTKNPSVPLVMDVEVKSSESSFVDEGTTTVRFQLSGFLTIALFILGACCAAVAYVRGVVTSSHSSIPIVFSVLYSLFCCAIAIFIFYVYTAKRFQFLWEKQRSCMLLDSPLARQKNCSPIVEGVTSMTDGEASLVPQQLSNPYNATGSVLLLMQRRSVAQQGYNMNERVRRYESTEMRKLSEKAMQHTARRYYKRQRQLLTNSTAFSNVQGTTIEEETGDVVSSGDFIDVSESVNEALTDSSGLDLLHVEMDQLSEKHREIESMSSNSSHYKHMCYRQI